MISDDLRNIATFIADTPWSLTCQESRHEIVTALRALLPDVSRLESIAGPNEVRRPVEESDRVIDIARVRRRKEGL